MTAFQRVLQVALVRVIVLASSGTTIVPTPSVVKISSSSACGTRPSSTWARGHAALDRAQAGLHLRHHAAGQRRQQSRQLVGVDLADDLGAGRPVGVQALDVGQHDELLGAERDRERGGGGVGVDVVGQAVRAAGDASR